MYCKIILCFMTLCSKIVNVRTYGTEHIFWKRICVCSLRIFMTEDYTVSLQEPVLDIGIHDLVNIQNVILISKDEWNYAFFLGKKNISINQHLWCRFNFEMCVEQAEMLPNFFQSSENTWRIEKNTNPRRETIMNFKPAKTFI